MKETKVTAAVAGSAGENGHAAQHGMANLTASARVASSELSVEGAVDHDRTLAMLQRQVRLWNCSVPTTLTLRLIYQYC